MRNILSVLLLCLFSVSGLCGATYFVSNSGSDSNAGTSMGSPWANAPGMTNCTATCASTTLNPGDSVLLQAGGIWRDTLTIPTSGSAGNQITYGHYGTGAQPVITAGNLSTWTQGPGQTQETCTGSCIFDSGFENGGATFTDWTTYSHPGTTSISPSSVAAAHGAYGAVIVGDGSNGASLFTSISALTLGSTYYFRFYFRYDASLAAAQVRALWLQTTGTQDLYVGISYGGSGATFGGVSIVGQATNTGGTVCSFSRANNWNDNSWNYLDFTYTISATVGATAASINGTPVAGCTATGLNTSGMAGANRLYIGNQFGPNMAANSILDIDDVRMTTGGVIGPYSGALPTTVWSASQATNPLYPISTNTNRPLTVETTGLDALSCCNSYAPIPVPNTYFWDGSATIYVYSPNVVPTSTIEIPTRTQAIFNNGKQYSTISGLDIRGAVQQGIFAGASVTGLSLLNDTIELNYESGVEIDTTTPSVTSNVTIDNNIMQWNGASGMQSDVETGMSGWRMSYNSFLYNSQIIASGYWANSGGIDLFCRGGTGPNVIFSNVFAYNGFGQTINGYIQGNGLWIDTCNSTMMYGNIAYNNASSGILVEKNNNSSAIYNIAYNNNTCVNGSNTCGGNITLRADIATSATDNTISNNTTFGGQAGIAAYWDQTGGAGATVCSGNVFQNNIAINSTRNLNIGYGCDNDGINGTGNVYSNSAFGVQGSGFVYWQSAGSLSTYTALDTAYGSPMNNVQSAVTLTNTTSADFRPARGSAVLTGGITGGQIGALGVVTPTLANSQSVLTGKVAAK